MNRDKSTLGIQIDDDFLRMVHLRGTAGEMQICGWACEPLEEGTVRDGVIIETKAVAQKIREFVKTQKLSKPQTIMTPSHQAVRLTLLQIIAQDNEQLYKQMEERVGKYGLFANEDIVSDFCVAQDRFQLVGKKTVLQAIIKKGISDSFLRVAQQAKLNLIAIEPAAMAIMRLLHDMLSGEAEEVSLMLSLDDYSGVVCVFRNGLLQLCQNLSKGVNDTLKDQQAVAELQEQMKPVVEYAQSQGGIKKPVLRLAASCEAAKVRQIAGEIRAGLDGVEVECIVPEKIKEQIGAKDNKAEGFPIIAYGLTLTEKGVPGFNDSVNLISEHSVEMHKTKRQLLMIGQTAIIIVVLSIAAIYPLKMQANAKETMTAELAAKVNDATTIVQKTTDITKEIGQLTEKQTVYASAVEKLGNLRWGNILQAIGEAVPENVRIVEISVTPSAEFVLKGEALREDGISSFSENLQKNSFAQSVRVEEVEYDITETGAAAINYKIIIKTQPEKTK